MIGTTLSHYEITAELGRGGMGIVYKARDTKLDREVAIKILPSAALASADDRERFYREAKSAAQLHHPNIASVFEIDEAVPDGGDAAEPRPFIAMEYIAGGTLQDRIKEAPLKLSDAVKIASQVAEALKAAHGKNIVHRDIKSANVMITEDGVAKVLDFGLAKTNQSTMLTRMGSTLGTVAYMSPEQARGQEVDGRTDLYSLGTMLYEMVAGRLPFAGEYEQAVVYSILNEPPEPLTSLRTGVPMQLEWIVNKLLAKDADYRYQSAADLLADLKSLDLSGSGMSRRTMPAMSAVTDQVNAEEPGSSGFSWRLPVAAIVLLVVGGLLGVVFSGGKQTEPRPTLSVSVDVPGFTNESLPSISPDGRYVAFTSSIEQGRNLVIYDLSTGKPHIMAEDGVEFRLSRFSPDGKWLVFERGDNGLGIVGVPDGIPAVLAESGTNPTWLDERTVAFNLDSNIAVVDRVSREITTVLESGLIWTINAVGDGRSVLFSMYDDDSPQMGIFDVKTREPIILGAGLAPRFIAPGHILYHAVDQQTGWSDARPVLAQAFDLSSKKLLGAPVQVMSPRQSWTMDVSPQGHLIALKDDRLSSVQASLSIVDPVSGSAKELPWSDDLPQFNSIGISGDGEWLAYSSGELDAPMFVREISRGEASPFVLPNTRFSVTYRLSEDGSSLHYSSGGGGIPAAIYSVPTDGSGSAERTFGDEDLLLHDRTADGNLWAVSDERNRLGWYKTAIVFINTVEDTRVEVDTTVHIKVDTGRFSPDKEYFAFDGRTDSDRAGSYVMKSDGSGPWKIGDEGNPIWNADGTSIFLRQDDRVVEIPLDLTRGVRAVGSPRTVYRAFGLRQAERMPDGSLLIIAGGNGNRDVASMRLVLDWGQRLNELAPGN